MEEHPHEQKTVNITKKVLSTTMLNFPFTQYITLFSHLSQLLKILLLRGSAIMKFLSVFSCKKGQVKFTTNKRI